MNKDRIPKLIITADQIESNWGLRQEEQITTCQYCGGMIFYVKKILGIVAEEGCQIMGWRSERNYRFTEIGFDIFCAECGKHSEGYHTFQYEKGAVVCEYSDIDGEEQGAIDFCLRQFNEKGDFKPLYKTGETRVLKEKLKDYEQKHPIKIKKLKKKRGKK